MPEFLTEEIAQWSSGCWEGPVADVVDGVTNDTRNLQSGNVYIALKGKSFDGHDFVEQSIDMGASAAIVQEDWYRKQGASLDTGSMLVVKDTQKALENLANGYRKKVNPKIIAVTGSAGKSTVKELAAQMVMKALPTAYTHKNWNNNIGLPLSLLSMDSDTRAGIFEVGTSSPGEIAALCNILEPTWGVVTNIGPVHIENFDSVGEIAREKGTMIEALPSDGLAVLNIDDDSFELLESLAQCDVKTVSTRNDADFVCVSRDPSSNTIIVAEKSTNEQVSITTDLIGEYNVTNILLAAAIARGLGITWPEITDAVRDFRPLSMRWEVLEQDGVKIINDAYNGNPMSMRAVINAYYDELAGDKWLVIADMLELGRDAEREHLSLGEYIAQKDCAGLIAIGELGEFVADGAGAAGMGQELIYRCAKLSDAATIVRDKIKSGSSVLLKASRGMYLERLVEQIKQ